ncbi:MAG: YbhN family protein [Phycisphaeraceae bacterium]
MPKRRKALAPLLRLAATGAILAVVLGQIDVGRILAHLGSASPAFFAAAVLARVAFRLVMVVKWKCLLDAEGIRLGLLRAARIVFLSSFYGSAVPGGVGADAMRLVYLGQAKQPVIRGAGALLADRLVNLVVMAGLSAVGTLLVWDRLGSPRVGAVVLGLSGAMMLAAAVTLWERSFLALRWVGERVLGWIAAPGSQLERVGQAAMGKMAQVHASLRALCARPGLMAKVVALALLAAAARVAMVDLLFRSLGSEVAVVDELAFVPMAQLLALLPITYFGLGVSEGAFAWFFQSVGVPAAEAVTVSLLGHAVIVMVLLAGGLGFALLEPAWRGAEPARAGRAEAVRGE